MNTETLVLRREMMSDKIVFTYRDTVVREVTVEGKSQKDMEKIFEKLLEDRDLGSHTVEDVAKENGLTFFHDPDPLDAEE